MGDLPNYEILTAEDLEKLWEITVIQISPGFLAIATRLRRISIPRAGGLEEIHQTPCPV